LKLVHNIVEAGFASRWSAVFELESAMNAGMVRTGGIMVFVLLVLGVVMSLVVAADAVKIGADGRPQITGGAILLVSNIIYVVIIVFVYWTTKGLFNALGYRQADIPIMVIMSILAVNLILGFIGGAGFDSIGSVSAMVGSTNVVGIISLIMMLVLFAAWLWFAMAALGFGNRIASGLWKGIGIVYLIGTVLFVLSMLLLVMLGVSEASGLAIGDGFQMLIGIQATVGMLVILAGWICHGIGLITGADRMGQA